MTSYVPPRASCPRREAQAGNILPVVLSALALVAVAAWLVTRGPPQEYVAPPAQTPVTFLNTDISVGFVGSEACRSCHADEFESHATTAHARSFGAADLDAAGLEGSFHHEASGLTLDMSVAEGRLHVREFLPGEGGGETIQAHALDFFLGSGGHWRTYIAMIDGLAVPAPVASFPPSAGPDKTGAKRSEGGWGIVPGQESADRRSFDGVLSPSCLRCHVGRLETGDEASGRVRILERAIGCESCHGAGALHVEKWSKQPAARTSDTRSSGERDDTIANPARMTAGQSMDVCNRCHISNRFTAPVDGRDSGDWRPGLLLSDFRLRFGEKGRVDDASMWTPADQLRASACFQRSVDMTCVTCHAGHGAPVGAERVAYFKAQCLTCHSASGAGGRVCGLPMGERLQVSADDDCVKCHMPRKESYQLHEPLHDHRIAIPVEEGGPRRMVRHTPEVEPLDDLSALSKIQLDRTLGTANLVLSWLPGRPLEERNVLLDRALQHFEAARDALVGVPQRGSPMVSDDPITEAGLASIYIQRKQKKAALEAARAAADSEKPVPRDVRVSAMRMASELLMLSGDCAQALKYLHPLTQIRRDAGDWERIGTCARELGDKDLVLRAAEKMLEIAPQRPSVQWGAAEFLRWLGLTERGEYHAQLGQRLESAKRRR